MGRLTFYIVDVFAEKKFAGNQLAVFRNVGDLDGDLMQKIAKEINYSESTFIKSDQPIQCGYEVRIFTPEEELPFAGHPTLGTAFVIKSEIVKAPTDTVELCLRVGSIPVNADHERGEDFLWMKQNRPEFLGEIDPQLIAEVLSLDVGDIDERFPVQEVSTGTPVIIAPVKTLTALRKARNNIDKYNELIAITDSKAVYFFTAETYDAKNQLNARLFADYYGVPEDPATGSAAGCLAGYLAEYEYFGGCKVEARLEQGHEIGRESLLYLKSEKKEDIIEVYVGGRIQMVARGELDL
jgi:trans-2,3-dihydro-3-hydroxyanthranilate isomerase